MELNCCIRKINQEEIENALQLVRQVFDEYEAPDYTQEGVEEFYKSIRDEKYLSELCWYGAFIRENLVGVLATRNAASPYAVPVYRKLGFKNTGSEQVVNGLRFTPMESNLRPVFPDLMPFLDKDGRLISFPSKHKKKLSALWYLAGKIEADRQYTESEINTLLDEWTLFHDPATLRRELYNRQLLNRTKDCSVYRKADNIPTFEEFLKNYV